LANCLHQGQSYIYIANGHGAWEATALQVLSRGDKVLVLESGRFAIGWGKCRRRRWGADVEVLKGDWPPRHPAGKSKNGCGRTRITRSRRSLRCRVDTASGAYNGHRGDRQGHQRMPALRRYHGPIRRLARPAPFEMDAWGIDVAMSGSQKGL